MQEDVLGSRIPAGYTFTEFEPTIGEPSNIRPMSELFKDGPEPTGWGMRLEDVFHITGRGFVLCGSILYGKAKVGDKVCIGTNIVSVVAGVEEPWLSTGAVLLKNPIDIYRNGVKQSKIAEKEDFILGMTVLGG